jgi:hypothetical protein
VVECFQPFECKMLFGIVSFGWGNQGNLGRSLGSFVMGK